jgi:hypothetical protein
VASNSCVRGMPLKIPANARVEALRSAPPDTWVALSDDESRVVAVANTYEEVALASDRAGEPDPVVVKIPKVWSSLSV